MKNIINGWNKLGLVGQIIVGLLIGIAVAVWIWS